VLQRFERRLEELVEGTFAKVFKGEVHPAEIAVAIQREADDRKVIVSGDRILVPNDYLVELGHRDHDRLAPYSDPLAEELAQMLREHADEHGYTFPGKVQVGFEKVTDLATGSFRIRSNVVAPPTAKGGVVTGGRPDAEAKRQPTSPFPGNPRLLINPDHVGISGPEARGRQRVVPIDAPRLLVGRAPDCDLKLTDPGVSRRHALIREERGVFLLEDLDSTNGTLVDDVPIGQHQLAPGERIQVGSTILVFQRDEVD
jgi:hypothetical protein